MQNEDETSGEIVTQMMCGPNVPGITNYNFKPTVNNVSQPNSTLPKSVLLKELDKISKDCELNIFQNIGKFFRPDLPICQYKELLDAIAAKKSHPIDLMLIFIFDIKKLYILTTEQILSSIMNGKEPKNTISNVSENLIDIFISRNLKTKNSL